MSKSTKRQLSVQSEGGDVITATESSHDGRLPPADDLRAYAEIQPDFPERYVVMVEKQQTHILGAHGTIIRENLDSKTRGQWMAFVISLVALGVVAMGIYFQSPEVAIGMSIVAAACGYGITRHHAKRDAGEQKDKSAR